MALGLSQFTPGTAAWIARVYPAQLGEAAPLDPKWAIRALTYYDHRLYGQVSLFQVGDERFAAALASYNAGLGWILKDQKEAIGICDNALWFECVTNIPDARTLANHKQSSDYPERILHVLRPLYVAAGWGDEKN